MTADVHQLASWPEGGPLALPANAETRDDLARSGAELVELSERFYRGVFVGAITFVALGAIAALALLPTREPSAGPPVTIALTVAIVALAPFAAWRGAQLYRLLRRQPRLELVLLALAAALVCYPLRSELWWPACGLLMLLGALVPLRRALGYCLTVLLCNLAAHALAADITTAPPVSMIGLWIGLVFWTATFALITDRFATEILQFNTATPDPEAEGKLRVRAYVPPPPPPAGAAGNEDTLTGRPAGEAPGPDGTAPAAEAPRPRVTRRLTARHLQVLALLADGMRYREIAACLAISERQVQRHVTEAIARAGARNTNELIAAAVSEGLTPTASASPDLSRDERGLGDHAP